MGHYNPAPDADCEIHVLVTGAGPFHTYKVNPSVLIARALPETIRGQGPSARTIRIHTIQDAWPVSYNWVRKHVPPILFPKPVTMPPDDDDDDSKTSDIRPTPETVDDDQSSQKQQPFYDVVLFIGMAAGRNYYTLEAVAHRDGHLLPDNDIKNMQGDTFWKDLGGPGLLKTTFDTDDVWRRWKSELMNEDVRPSNDAGRFLCDFIYYTGLVEYLKQNPEGDRPVMFLHVPGEYEEDDIQRGAKIASGLIKALVQSHVECGKLT